MSKLKIILIILLVVVLILAGVFWYLTREQDSDGEVILPPEDEEQLPSTTNEELETETVATTQRPVISEEEKLKAQLAKTAKAFTERYGSYSNHSDFENLRDLEPFITRSLQSSFQQIINRGSSNDPIYFGVTTKVLKATLEQFAPNQNLIEFKVSTQRHEVVGSTVNSRTYYQDLKLQMLQEGGVWKVNEVEWQ